jgi:O-6-methylguanine DNA methyltransferase
MPGELIRRDCIVGLVPVTQHRYAADGWGVGEVWLDGDVLLLHELAGTVPGLALRTAPDESGAAARGLVLDQHEVGAVSGQRNRGAAVGLPLDGGAGAPTGTLALQLSPGGDGFVSDLCRRFEEHLAGRPTTYDDVRIDDGGMTDFQRELLAALRAVPWGDVVSYGELAALAGRPGAARAAGSFCAESQHSLVVPCHRVVSGSGIGGYGPSGVALKRRLLALEGVEL